MNVADGTAVPSQTAGDCQQVVCDGNGATKSQADDADLPNDGKECTDDTCAAGVPTFTPKTLNVACGAGGALFCDGNGACVGCTGNSQCGAATDCATPTCSAGQCTTNFTAPGTATPNQTLGDCQEVQCNGIGGTKTVAKTSDVQDDNNACTNDVCNGSTPATTNVATGAACTNGALGKYCNGAGSCVECLTAADCSSGVCTLQACAAPTCTDSVKNGAETDVDCGGASCPTCANGDTCSVDGDCTSTVCNPMKVCVASICGDNRITGAETCDDGGTTSGNGCSATCAVEAGWECTGVPSVCHLSCGDSTLDPGETCDDGGTTGGNGCSATCTVEAGYKCSGTPSVCIIACGDGVKDAGEACDDGDAMSGDGCSATCTIEAGYVCTGTPSMCVLSCGNGTLDAGETCDDGALVNGDGCSSACLAEAGYTCTGAPSSCVTMCGDGIVAGTEQCDDSNTVAGDCCSATCTAEAGCEIEPNDSLATANAYGTVFVSGEVKGLIDPTDDIDIFMMTVPAAQEGIISAATVDGFQGTTCASLALDSYIAIYDSMGIPIAGNDDKGPADYCSSVTSAKVAAGDYYVAVTKSSLAGATDTFDYTLQASVTTSAPADDCLAADCVAGATCVDLPGGFVCNCAAGTYGNGRMSGTGCVAGSGLYYAFDGTGTSVPNLATVAPAGAANATIVGTQTQGSSGKCGTGLVGSGGLSTANYVNTGWATSLSGPWTVSFWLKNFNATSAALQYIFGDNTAQLFRCFAGGAAGDTNLLFRGTGMGDLLVPGAANGSLAMVTFVYDPAARNVKAYLNGTLVNAVGQSTPLSFAGAGPFKVGGYSASNALPANAVLDDFRFYFRALSATEVTTVYNSATCGAVLP